MDLGAPSRAKRALCELKMALYIQNLQKSGGGGTCPPVPTVPTSMIGTEFFLWRLLIRGQKHAFQCTINAKNLHKSL